MPGGPGQATLYREAKWHREAEPPSQGHTAAVRSGHKPGPVTPACAEGRRAQRERPASFASRGAKQPPEEEGAAIVQGPGQGGRPGGRGGSRQVGGFRCESRFCHHRFRLRCHLCAVKSGAGPGVCAPVPSPAEPGDRVPTLGAPPPPCPARFLPPTPRPPVSGSVLAGSCFPVGGDAPVLPPRLLEAVAAGTRPACGECGGSCCPLPPLGTFRRGELASLGGPASESPGG